MIVRFGGLKVDYTITNTRISGSTIPLVNYKQQDVHSCGFVAALTVAQYYNQDIPPTEVLKAVRPSINWGVNQDNLIIALEKLGVNVEFREDLTITKLRRSVNQGVPVIVSVWPDGWLNDHWTVVHGFSADRIYLTNYKSLLLETFLGLWSDMDMRGKGQSREGLVCTPQ